jgi:hypothetical protein
MTNPTDDDKEAFSADEREWSEERYKYWGIRSEKDKLDSCEARSRIMDLIFKLEAEGKSYEVILGAVWGTIGAAYGDHLYHEPEREQELRQDVTDCINYHFRKSYEFQRQLQENSKNNKEQFPKVISSRLSDFASGVPEELLALIAKDPAGKD